MLKIYPHILLVMLLCSSILIWQSTALAKQPPKLKPAPQWQALTQAGKPIGSANYQGKPVILHFWATWCPYCKRLQPKLVELQQKYANKGVEIIAISFNEDDDAHPQTALEKRGYHFKTAIKGEAVAKLFHVRGTPTTFFINPSGNIVYRTSSSNVKNPNFEKAIKIITR